MRLLLKPLHAQTSASSSRFVRRGPLSSASKGRRMSR
jgi:hypothetical protein